MNNDYMSPEARAELNRYHREWRKNNPEKVKARNRRYWEKRAAERLEKESKRVD